MSPRDRLKWLILLAVACLSGYVSAADPMPIYETEASVRGEIRVTGDIEDLELIETLQAEFGRYQPGVHFKNSLHGPESTLAGVYTGTADLAFMAREIREPLERMAFEWAKLAKPYAVVFANAGFEKHRPGTQLAVFVHGENPVDVLSLAELDAIFGAEHKRGSKNIRAWGRSGRERRMAGTSGSCICTGTGQFVRTLFSSIGDEGQPQVESRLGRVLVP